MELLLSPNPSSRVSIPHGNVTYTAAQQHPSLQTLHRGSVFLTDRRSERSQAHKEVSKPFIAGQYSSQVAVRRHHTERLVSKPFIAGQYSSPSKQRSFARLSFNEVSKPFIAGQYSSRNRVRNEGFD